MKTVKPNCQVRGCRGERFLATTYCKKHMFTEPTEDVRENIAVALSKPGKFDLEQALLDCWHVTTDIEHVYDGHEVLTPDQLANVLLGLKELYELKFNKLWQAFEQSIKNGDL